MKIDRNIVCTKCRGTSFVAKREATYVYSYKIDGETNKNNCEELPYLFDNREQMNSKEYLECEKCGACYPCVIEKGDDGIEFVILQKAIRSEYVTKPEFLG